MWPSCPADVLSACRQVLAAEVASLSTCMHTIQDRMQAEHEAASSLHRILSTMQHQVGTGGLLTADTV